VLDDQEVMVQILAGTRDYTVLWSIETGSGAHSASYSIGTDGPYPGDEIAGACRWPQTSRCFHGVDKEFNILSFTNTLR